MLLFCQPDQVLVMKSRTFIPNWVKSQEGAMNSRKLIKKRFSWYCRFFLWRCHMFEIYEIVCWLIKTWVGMYPVVSLQLGWCSHIAGFNFGCFNMFQLFVFSCKCSQILALAESENSSGFKYVLFLYSFAWKDPILRWWLTYLLWLLVLWLVPSPLLVSLSLYFVFATICNTTICKSCFILVFL